MAATVEGAALHLDSYAAGRDGEVEPPIPPGMETVFRHHLLARMFQDQRAKRRKIGHRQNTYCKFPHSGESCCFFIGKRPSGRKNNFFRKKIKFHPGEIENGLGCGETGKGR